MGNIDKTIAGTGKITLFIDVKVREKEKKHDDRWSMMVAINNKGVGFLLKFSLMSNSLKLLQVVTISLYEVS